MMQEHSEQISANLSQDDPITILTLFNVRIKTLPLMLLSFLMLSLSFIVETKALSNSIRKAHRVKETIPTDFDL